jgi:mRNA interferase MazF
VEAASWFDIKITGIHTLKMGRMSVTLKNGVYEMLIRRGDIYYADLRPVVGSEQGGVRPVLIIQNDVGNRHSPTVICAAITSRMNKAKLPTHIELNAARYHMVKDSVILLEQLRTIDKTRLKDRICHLDSDIMKKVGRALQISLEL